MVHRFKLRVCRDARIAVEEAGIAVDGIHVACAMRVQFREPRESQVQGPCYESRRFGYLYGIVLLSTSRNLAAGLSNHDTSTV